MFQRACQLGWEGTFRAARLALPLRPVAGLAQVQEPGCAGSPPGGGGGGLGTMRKWNFGRVGDVYSAAVFIGSTTVGQPT